jgi:ataxia telangiectasia mutated family protein
MHVLANILISNSDALKDNAYHQIFEALFKVASAEKQTYLTGKTPRIRSTAENTLSDCSDVLRMTIRAGLKRLKRRTIKAIIEHVTQLLPAPDGGYCAGLSKSYIRVLITVFEDEAHIEQLAQDDWLSAVDFCLEGIKKHYAESNNETPVSHLTSSGSGLARAVPNSAPPLILSSRFTSVKESSNSVSRRNAEDLMECVLSLVSASNAPILDRVEPLMSGIVLFLRTQGSVSPSHQVVFSSLNIILSATSADRLSLSQRTSQDLVSVVAHLWSTKAVAKDVALNSVRDKMLIAILLLDLHMEKLVLSEVSEEFLNDLAQLEAVLRNEYSKRSGNHQLQLDDLDLAYSGGGMNSDSILKAGLISLRPCTPRSERTWALLQTLCLLNRLLNMSTERAPVSDDNIYMENQSRKRRRVTALFDPLLEGIASNDIGERLVALQTLLFIVPSYQFTKHALVGLLSSLNSCINERRRNVASWALLVIARYYDHHAP